ncbi:MAG: GNAT family N-acetyltransferase [Candidatus Heimdallarchaeota archaeon]
MSKSRINFKKRKIRSLFLASDKKKACKEDLESELTAKGLEYIQMRLSIQKITPEFENKIKERVEGNILKAKIREASENDLESVVYLHNRAWMTSNEPFSPLSIESLKNLFEYPEIKIFIAKVYGIDAGFVILDFEGPNDEYGIIAGLGVLTRFQRKGLGTVLGMAVWNYLKEKGIKELRCEVYKDNQVSYNFIKSLGFEEYDTKIYKCEDFEINNR